MTKKIEDIVTLKKGETGNVLRPVLLEKTMEPTISEIAAKPAERIKEMEHAEEILPKTPAAMPVSTAPSIPKEKVIDESPIFKKMAQKREERESFSEEYKSEHSGGFNKRIGLYAFVGFCFAAIAIFAYDRVFYSATVTVHMKKATVALNNQKFTATEKEAGTIPFQIMTFSGEETKNLAPTGEKRVTKKASGKIVVYNNYGKDTQTLIKSTRFQTPDGKIYRIASGIQVPGTKVVAGKTVPGSVEATVFADEPGAEYNIGLSDFKIPGFKGSPRYDKFYARSKTPMTGGMNGKVKIVSEADIKTAKEALMKTLTEKLLANASAEKPAGTVFYPDAAFLTFTDSVNDTDESEKEVPFTLKGDANVVLFDEAELSRSIAASGNSAVAVGHEDKIEIKNIGELVFAWEVMPSSTPEKTETLSFLLSGNPNAVWVVDPVALKTKLVGASEAKYGEIEKSFPHERIDRTIRPWWRKSFPGDPAKITVKAVVD